MTKEELAKRKGTKTKEKAKTAAETLISTPSKQTPDKKTEMKNIGGSEKSSTQKEVPAKKENNSKVGRPKGKPSTKISFNVPNEFIELINIAAGLRFKGNTSGYIVSLIEDDINKNSDLYKKIKELNKK